MTETVPVPAPTERRPAAVRAFVDGVFTRFKKLPEPLVILAAGLVGLSLKRA